MSAILEPRPVKRTVFEKTNALECRVLERITEYLKTVLLRYLKPLVREVMLIDSNYTTEYQLRIWNGWLTARFCQKVGNLS